MKYIGKYLSVEILLTRECIYMIVNDLFVNNWKIHIGIQYNHYMQCLVLNKMTYCLNGYGYNV